VSSGRFAGLEIADRQAMTKHTATDRDVELRSRLQFQRARELVAEFVPPAKVDIAAMALVMLRAAHPSRSITRTMVRERVLQDYPDAEL
jgi:hypothetical protein